MRLFDKRMAQYASYHQKFITKLTHFIGIPFIIFSLMILLSSIYIEIPHYLHLSLAWLAVIAILIYYFILNFKLALIATPIFVVLNLVASWIALPQISKFSVIAFLGFFIIGWLLQLIGHLFEGKKPALVDNFSQVFIAPLFLIAEIMTKKNNSPQIS